MKMRISDSQGFATELLKELLFPARCPVCDDLIPAGRRAMLLASVRRTEKERQMLPADGNRDGSPGILCGKGGREETEILYRGLICDSCRETFAYIREPFCRKCGKQLRQERAEKGECLCRDCASKERLFRQCRCMISYDETARDIMAAVKYHSRKEFLDLFAVMASDRLGAWIREFEPAFVIPVPVHVSRLRTRGYNQAGVFAEKLASLLGLRVREDVLVRRKNTAAQKELGAEERLLNLQNAFGCAVRLSGRPAVLLVDDIYTTGSTMEACTEALLSAGAGEVFGLCICAGEDD